MRTAKLNHRTPSQGDRARGAATIEFALVPPNLVMLPFAMMEFGRIYNAKLNLANAAREAARTGAIRGLQPMATVLTVSG